MKLFQWAFATIYVAALACTSASSEVVRAPIAYNRTPQAAPKSVAAVINDSNIFGLSVFHRLAPKDQNFAMSPASGFVALAMTSSGALGATSDEMKAVLYPDVTTPDVQAAANRLEQRIRGYARPLTQTQDGEKKVELHLTNDVFIQKGLTIKETFLDNLAANHDCGVERVDYKNNPDAAATLISSWVAKATNNRIQNMITPGTLDTLTRLVLVNALYLYSSWQTAFSQSATRPQTFHSVGGDSTTEFMNAELILKYASGTGWAAADIPYYGGSLVFTAILPDAGQFDDLKANIDATWLSEFDSTASPHTVALKFPKFKFAGTTVSWVQTLQALGIRSLFEPRQSNLGGITEDEPIYVKDVLQKVFIEVTEKGTEAAAATALVFAFASYHEPPPRVPLVLDRPFLFFIREPRGPILFAGQVVSLGPGKLTN